MDHILSVTSTQQAGLHRDRSTNMRTNSGGTSTTILLVTYSFFAVSFSGCQEVLDGPWDKKLPMNMNLAYSQVIINHAFNLLSCDT